MNYNFMKELGEKRGFTSFTELQQSAFENPETYNFERNVFVMGQTSSGKTLIPQLIYNAALEQAIAEGKEYPKMLFAVPYRALAAQKVEEMQEFFSAYDLKIIQSTGEFRQDDEAIQRGEVHIALVITEKVFKYEARDSGFLSKYDYLVIDEIGLINNPERGVRLDFILAWADSIKKATGKPRVIALGTPFFDWSAYIESYNFLEINAGKRPVKLKEISVCYSSGGIESVEGDCSFLHRVRAFTEKDYRAAIKSAKAKEEGPGVPCSACTVIDDYCPYELPCRSDLSQNCHVSGEPCMNPVEFLPSGVGGGLNYMLYKICKEHLLLGHQILIFINDRERVKQYCRVIYRMLKDMLPEAPSPEECKAQILSECGLDSEDVYGILEYDNGQEMEQEFFQAFKSGVGFHSAALPNELRTYVEKKLLGSREMKIVCSTETLAFGVNSSVDVVIVGELYKQEYDTVRPLSMNEYQNYAGRSGRLRSGVSSKDVNGYVYTLVKKNQVDSWAEMRENAGTPEKLYSLFHSDEQNATPFFLLNLLPASSESSMTLEQLSELVSILPSEKNITKEELAGKLESSMEYLISKGLVVTVSAGVSRRGRFGACEEETKEKYCLTNLGNRLRGYIIGRSDYETILAALEEYVDSVFLESDKATFLRRLLQTKHAEYGLNGIFSDSETRCSMKSLRKYIKSTISEENDIPAWISTANDEKKMYILAALIAWTEGESARMLYRKFGIHYALLDRVAEQIAYLIEIAVEILPFRMEKIWREKQDIYAEAKITIEEYVEAVNTKVREMHELFASVYYGININISNMLINYLNERAAENPEAAELAEKLSLSRINPKSARQLRRIAVRYKFFRNPPAINTSNIEERNNLYYQRSQYKKDIKKMEKPVEEFFIAMLGKKYTD